VNVVATASLFELVFTQPISAALRAAALQDMVAQLSAPGVALIDLLEKSQEYRCCPADEEETAKS
jgi:hypothetical protein